MDGKVEKIDVRSFVKGQASMKGKSITAMADRLQTTQSSLSGMLIRKKMKVQMLIDILDVLDEDFVIILKNGSKYKIEL